MSTKNIWNLLDIFKKFPGGIFFVKCFWKEVITMAKCGGKKGGKKKGGKKKGCGGGR